MFILVHSKPRATSSLLRTLRKSTKQSHIDHLHNNQENDLEHLKTHTLLGQHTNTKIADLDPLKNTHPISANTETKHVQQSTRITLVTKENLKSIQAESYSTHFDQSQILSNLNSLKNSYSKTYFHKSVFLNIFKDVVCYQILTNSFIAFNDWSKHLKTGA